MKKTKITIVTNFYLPQNISMSYLNHKKINNLLKFYPEYEVTDIYQTEAEGENPFPNAKKHNFSNPGLWNYRQPLKETFLKAFIKDKGDILVSFHHSFSTAITCFLKKAIYRKPWISVIHDIDFAIFPYQDLPPFPDRLPKKEKKIDWISTQLILRFADQVIFTDRNQKEFTLENYHQKNKKRYKIIPSAHSAENKKAAKINLLKKDVNFVYTGNFSHVRDGQKFFKAIDQLMDDNSHLKMNILGGTLEIFEWYRNDIKNKQNFSFKPYSPNSVVKEYKKNADILVVFDADLGIKNYPYMPSKFVDYLGEKKRIFLVAQHNSPAAEAARSMGIIHADFVHEKIVEAIKEVIISDNIPTNLNMRSPKKTAELFHETIQETLKKRRIS